MKDYFLILMHNILKIKSKSIFVCKQTECVVKSIDTTHKMNHFKSIKDILYDTSNELLLLNSNKYFMNYENDFHMKSLLVVVLLHGQLTFLLIARKS